MADPGGARLLEENLAALAAGQPSLAAAVRNAAPDPRLVALSARNGMIVPGVRAAGGTLPLHSLYDPRQDSARFAQTLGDAGLLVVSGLGAGVHVEALLEDRGVHAVIVIEKDAAVFRALFAIVPLARLLADPRVVLVCGRETIRMTVLGLWQPALMGGMRTIPLRPWCDLERAFFDSAALEVQAAIEEVRSDYSVQSHFGKRWLTNILMNLRAVGPMPKAAVRGTRAVVTAAGPSLERHLSALAADRRGTLLVATDTSLPTLVRSGIRPDAVLSIDCQNHSYHHFLHGIPAGTSLFLDLASPAVLARRGVPPIFLASTHPFSRYVDSHLSRMPRIDTSGGNVTHAAVSLARALGARRISVYGADFSYPDGKAYARGTYLYDYFWLEQDRLSPAEAKFYSFVHGSGSVRSHSVGGRVLSATPLLTGYRERFMRLVETIDAEVILEQATGSNTLSRDEKTSAPATARIDPWPRPSSSASPGSPPPSWRDFLLEYARNVERLDPSTALAGGQGGELWRTILPVAARVVREGFAPGPGALEEARRWSLERIRRVLQAPADFPRE